MAETYIQQLSMQNATWLAARQAVISSNVANANTPGYKTQDIRPFAEAIEQVALTPVVSNSAHLVAETSISSNYRMIGGESWETFHSGGDVNLENEMIKASEVSADYRLNTSIVRSFHHMFLSMVGT